MWGATADNGLYAPANKFPPSFKPTKQMLLLKRRIYGLVTQFRTGHAFTGEYYRHSVPDNPRSCTCGEPLETREHIMFVCPTYEEHRHLARNKALARFLSVTGAASKDRTPLSEHDLQTIPDSEDEEEEDGDEGDEGDDGGEEG